jgi:outer membrane immunogenic protein
VRSSELIFSAAVAISAVVGIGAASAADLPARVYTKAPVMVDPGYNWSGFYIGGDVGGGVSRQTATTFATPAGFGAPAILGAGIAGIGLAPLSQPLSQSRFLGGVYAGYNWQMNKWVVGLEADGTFLSRNARNTQELFALFSAPPTDTGPFTTSSSNNWVATVRGRVGYTWDKLMLYGTGGAAFTRTNYSDTYTSMNIAPPLNPVNANFSSNKVGFAVGAGAEWMATQNWVLRAEYLYYRFDGSSTSTPITAGGCAGCAITTNAGALEFQTGRVGLAYKFEGPAVTKY